jgi:hypothetical protein
MRYAQKQDQGNSSNNMTQILPSLGLRGTILELHMFQVDNAAPDSGPPLKRKTAA